MDEQKKPETFIVDEWVEYYHGEDRRKVKVIAVDGDVVTTKLFGQEMTFAPRPSDGMHVKVGSPDHEVMPDMIYHAKPKPEGKKQSRFKDAVDFLHGMFWGSSR